MSRSLFRLMELYARIDRAVLREERRRRPDGRRLTRLRAWREAVRQRLRAPVGA